MTTTMGKMIADVYDPLNSRTPMTYTTELHYTEKSGMVTHMWNLSGQKVIGYDGNRKVYLLESKDNEH